MFSCTPEIQEKTQIPELNKLDKLYSLKPLPFW